jgi:hypothetical protein
MQSQFLITANLLENDTKTLKIQAHHEKAEMG